MSYDGEKMYELFMKDNKDLPYCTNPSSTELNGEVLNDIYKYASMGMYERQIAIMIGVSDKTLTRMKQKLSCVKDALKQAYKDYGKMLFEKKYGKIESGSLNMLNHGIQRFDRIKNPYNSKEENDEAQQELDDEFINKPDSPIKK